MRLFLSIAFLKQLLLHLKQGILEKSNEADAYNTFMILPTPIGWRVSVRLFSALEFFYVIRQIEADSAANYSKSLFYNESHNKF